MAIEVKTKKWGNSIGIIIPNETIEKLDIKPEENVIIDIKKKDNALKDLFGSIKFRKPTKKLLNEIREELESKWLR